MAPLVVIVVPLAALESTLMATLFGVSMLLTVIIFWLSGAEALNVAVSLSRLIPTPSDLIVPVEVIVATPVPL